MEGKKKKERAGSNVDEFSYGGNGGGAQLEKLKDQVNDWSSTEKIYMFAKSQQLEGT